MLEDEFNMRDYRYWVLYGIELLTILIPFGISYVTMKFLYKKEGMRLNETLLSTIFAIYIFGVLHFTGSGTFADLKRYGIEFRGHQLNLIPFSQDVDIIAYILNVILFMPLGFLLPLIWVQINKWIYIVIYGSSFSFLIEISQIFNNRRTDIDDLILNILGTIIGYVLFLLYAKVSREQFKHPRNTGIKPVIYLLFMFLGHFCFYNEFGLAKILFNIK